MLAQTDADRGTLEPSRLDDIRDTGDIVIDALADLDVVPKAPKKRALVELDDTEEKEAKAAEDAEELGEEEEREISEPIPQQLSDDWKVSNAVLCVASRTALDETVALALARLLRKYGIGTKVIDAQHLRHGNLTAEDREGVRLICVSALDVREEARTRASWCAA